MKGVREGERQTEHEVCAVPILGEDRILGTPLCHLCWQVCASRRFVAIRLPAAKCYGGMIGATSFKAAGPSYILPSCPRKGRLVPLAHVVT